MTTENQDKKSVIDKYLEKQKKLQDQLQQTKNKLSQLQAKANAEERKKRTAKLCDTASIFDMVNSQLIETKADTDLFRQVLGLALTLNELRSNSTPENNQQLAQLEHKAKEFLENRKSNN